MQVKRKNNKKARDFWASVDEARAEVEKWPAWMRNIGIAEPVWDEEEMVWKDRRKIKP